MRTMILERGRVIEAPLARVWEVISDLDGYQAHADGLEETTVVSGSGKGAVRRCVDNSGSDWFETCTVWDPGRRYEVDVDISSYPLKYRALFRAFRGIWRMEPTNGGTKLTVRFEAELRPFPGLSTVVHAVARRGESDLESILDSYERHAVPGPSDRPT